MGDDINDIIRSDYNALMSQVQIPATDNSVKKILHPQTIKGHAESGHGLFNGNQRDLSFKQIYDAIGINSSAAALYREILSYEVMSFVDDLIDGKTKKIANKYGAPLFRFAPAENINIQNVKSVVKGIVLAGRMDSNVWRQKTTDEYITNLEGEKLIIGHGQEERVNTGMMRRLGLTENLLSNKIYREEQIQKYTKKGLFVGKKEKSRSGIEKMFVRTAPGLGCCDDSSILSMGLIHGPEAIWGGWMVDAVDTYSKFMKNTQVCGLDEIIGEYASHKWKEKYNEEIVSSEETMQIIYLGSKNNFPKINLSSSHSRFIRYEKQQPRTTIENHYRYAEKHKRPEKAYRLGFTRLDSNKFYNAIESRFNKMELSEYIPKKEKKKRSPRKLKKRLKK